MLIIDSSFKFNLHKKKDETELYYYSESKTFKKCQTYIKLKNDKIIGCSNEHKQNTINYEEIRKNLQKEIKNSSKPFSIKVPIMVKSVSTGKCIRYPSYKKLKNTLY
jgi:hypothetical protein